MPSHSIVVPLLVSSMWNLALESCSTTQIAVLVRMLSMDQLSWDYVGKHSPSV